MHIHTRTHTQARAHTQARTQLTPSSFVPHPNPCLQHFLIPHPTPAYTALLSLLPDEYVGTASRLKPLVQCVCGEMAASFEARGLTLPPWRSAQAMTSKWLPQRSKDTAIVGPRVGSGSSPTAPAIAAAPAAAAVGASPAAMSCYTDSEYGASLGASPGASAPIAIMPPAAAATAMGLDSATASGGGVAAGASPGVVPCSFRRLDEHQLQQQAALQRSGSRGLLSDKLLGLSRQRRDSCGSTSSSSSASSIVVTTRFSGSGCAGDSGDDIAGPAAAAAAVAAPCALALRPAAPAAAAARGGAAGMVSSGDMYCEDTRLHGGTGVLSRQPPVCSGQPSMWRVRFGARVAPQGQDQQSPAVLQVQDQQQ